MVQANVFSVLCQQLGSKGTNQNSRFISRSTNHRRKKCTTVSSEVRFFNYASFMHYNTLLFSVLKFRGKLRHKFVFYIRKITLFYKLRIPINQFALSVRYLNQAMFLIRMKSVYFSAENSYSKVIQVNDESSKRNIDHYRVLHLFTNENI